jgi:type I restriction enzyme S subunit
MSEWKNSPLDNVLEKIVGGGTPSRIKSEYWDGSIPWMSIKDYTDSKLFIDDTQEHITAEAIRNCATNLVPKGTPIIGTRVGVGKIAIPTVDIAINQDLKALFPNDLIEKTFLAYYLLFKQNDFIRIGVGSTVIGITLDQLKSSRIQHPTSLPEQRKIARILSTVDAVIEKTESAIAKYKAIKSGMMHDLFTRGIDLKTGKLRPRYEDAPGLYKESVLGWVPREWDVLRIDEVSQNFDGKRRPIKEGDRSLMQGTIPYYGASGIIDYVNDFIFDEPLILLGEDGENVVSRNLPLAFIVNGKAWVNNHAHVLKPNIDMDIIYLAEYLEHLDYSDIVSGSAQPKITQNTLNKKLVKKPNLDEQIMISKRMKIINSTISEEELFFNKYQHLKSALMSDLLTGKVRVQYNENDKAEAM